VFMVAPAENQSGSSASISPDGITVTDHGLNVWSVGGRPADAVRFGLGQLMADQPPDLVISGINFGQNVGADVMISGTVGAATTAVRLGIPAIAISASIDFKEAGEAFPSTLKAMPKAAAFLAKQLRDLPLEDKAMLINVNYPSIDRPKGVLTTSLSPTSIIGRGYTQTASGEWRANYALAGDALSSEATPNEDRAALQAGFITVSPLRASYAAVEPSPFVLQALEALGE
ncbi:MAG: 5'/3'-nucleotidase SurE, partial [Gammaproteobacteria bacterium]